MPIVEKKTDANEHGLGKDRRWHAAIDLHFKARADKTVLSKLRFSGPLRVQRPFYPEGEVCHVYLLHPPGGMVSGDHIDISATVGAGAHALLTTPSAGKVYASDSNNVIQKQTIKLYVDNGICEWLPQENIVFDGANASLITHVELSGGAKFMGWDMLALGRPVGDLPFKSGCIRQALSITQNGLPLLIERFLLDGELELLTSHAGLMGFPFMGNFYMVAPDLEQLIDKIRERLPEPTEALILAATFKQGIVIVRGFSQCAEQLRNHFIQLWGTIRYDVVQREACFPRIWST